jgi:hypothetical protein
VHILVTIIRETPINHTLVNSDYLGAIGFRYALHWACTINPSNTDGGILIKLQQPDRL